MLLTTSQLYVQSVEDAYSDSVFFPTSSFDFFAEYHYGSAGVTLLSRPVRYRMHV